MGCITFDRLSITLSQFVGEANDSNIFAFLTAAFIIAIISVFAFFTHNK